MIRAFLLQTTRITLPGNDVFTAVFRTCNTLAFFSLQLEDVHRVVISKDFALVHMIYAVSQQ